MNTMNVNIVVPDWVNWIAVDKNGDCYGFNMKPNNIDASNEWGDYGNISLEFVRLYMGKPPKNWKDELYTWG